MLCTTLKFFDEKAVRGANKEADLLELQADLFEKSDLKKIRTLSSKPVILKLKTFDRALLDLSPEYVDLPHVAPKEVWETLANDYPRITRIGSYHNFTEGGDLHAVHHEIGLNPYVDVIKIATMANSILDALRMLQLVKEKKCIGISMGEKGSISRILAPIFGAAWTYAPLSAPHKTAPGQLLLHELTQIYHYRTLSSATALYGLIGQPVDKSPSHRMHNFAFKKLGLNAIYVKMEMAAQEVEAGLPLIKNLGFKGLSVTMPLKEVLAPYLKDPSPQAVNTLLFTDAIEGSNTDGPGALDAIEMRKKVAGAKVVLLGAGGAARGVALEAKKRGATVVILNRTLSRAQKLAQEVGGTAFSLNDFSAVAHNGYDILINATSIGFGVDSRLPVPAQDLLEEKIVMDIISRPKETPLLKAAKKKKCTIIDGMEMFTCQALYQYMRWFNIK